ncbi:unnamed protein product [Protopolystoma xenopodis]|uniref:Neurotransmitter-gated ion-channel ligand-binding domain-containing protein n=1 Tax=Protopolystoma xenopodis TaxID=117903 RepID=A0A448X7N1_9PLAT|nr:unnamed protein product [Protopolystoma xenopodis]
MTRPTGPGFRSSRVASEEEARLAHHLFIEQAYNPLIRPVKNLTDVVDVQLGLTMTQIIYVVSVLQACFNIFLQDSCQ